MLKKNLIYCLTLTILLGVFVVFNVVFAQFGLDRFTGDSMPITDKSIPEVVTSIISYVIGIIGIILIVLIVYGGVLYATSSGNEEQIERGKKVLTYSIIGIVIVALSFVITNYVIVGLFSDQSYYDQFDQASSGGGSGGGTQQSGGPDDNTTQRSRELIEQGNINIGEGQDEVRRGEEMIIRGQELNEQGNESAGRILIDDGQDLVSSGNDRISEGQETREEGYALVGGSRDENDRYTTNAAEVDIDCQQTGDRCGILRDFCCSHLECDGAIADSGWPAFAGECAYGNPECKEEGERCVILGQDCCGGLSCSEGYCTN
ncbi:MAG: hypothetical protein HQ538_07030 [Parcubacteria group bacterium]|nr:hypothetical protein [Parcubacteria group bacterium]